MRFQSRRLLSRTSASALACAALCLALSGAAAETPRMALRKTVPQVKFDAIALSEAIAYIRDISNLNLRVDWKSLEAAGIDKTTPVTFHLRNISVERALNTVLREVGGGTKLAMEVDDYLVEITTQEQADRNLVTEVYDIRDLQFTPLDAGEPPQIEFQLEAITRGAGGGGGSQDLFQGSNTGTQETRRTPEERGQEIVDLITAVIRPEVWTINGGPATVRYYNGTLIVSAPRSVQALIGMPVKR